MTYMFAHREADRVPITDGPWGSTVARWRREGMPENIHWADYFGLDKFTGFSVVTSPRYPVRTIEETEEYVTRTTEWGTTLKQWKTHGGKLAFHGGINAALYPQPEKLYAEMRAVIPEMKKNGGYVVSTDRSVPDSVSLEDFRRFVELAKELAKY